MQLGSILTAIITPFDADLRVDEEAFVAPHAPPRRQRLRRIRRLRDDRRGRDARRRRAPAASSSWPSRERPTGATIVAGVGSNDTRHAVHLTERACALGADALLSVNPYYNRPNRRGILAHYREVVRADRPPDPRSTTSPQRTGSDMPNDLLAELAQLDHIGGVKQANNDNLALVDGLQLYAGNDDILARTLDLGGAGGILVASHVVGAADAPHGRRARRARRDRRRRCRTSTHALGVGPAAMTTKAALNLLGHPVGDPAPPVRGGRRIGDQRDPLALAAPRAPGTGERLMAGKLRVLPLGGLGEIGKNMTVLEYEGRIARRRLRPALPDRRDGRHRPRAARLRLPARPRRRHRGRSSSRTATRITSARCRGSCASCGRSATTAAGLRRAADDGDGALQARRAPPEGRRGRGREGGGDARAGPFDVELDPHDALDPRRLRGRGRRRDLGTVLITGDYKFDQTPVDGPPADVGRLAELGSEGVLLLCGDSTNADRPGFSPSEAQVGPHLQQAFLRCEGRIIVTCFASNIHRVQQVVDAAASLNRKVALRRALDAQEHEHRAHRSGTSTCPTACSSAPREIDDFPDERIVIVSHRVPGRAAERAAPDGLQRPPAGRSCAAATPCVFAATPIPGNERAVNETIDRLYHIGCTVVTARDAPVHASGHGYAEEIKLMLNLVKPKYVMPFHGDFKRLELHGAARRVGRHRPPTTSSRARTACRSSSTSAARASASPSARA